MSTRQATPGSSTGAVPQAASMNSRKRGTAESDGEPRYNKKLKKDDSITSAPKDKKKRRKRRRKTSIVTAATVPESRPRSKSRSVTVGTQSTAPDQTATTPATAQGDIAPETEDLSMMDGAEEAISRIPYTDKGKGKAKEESPPSETIEPHKAQIARLKQELEAQSLLLQRHQTHLTQVHQAITCQICLDLLYKPFALAPCGHVVCHGCLVRWFTANDNPHPLEERIPGVPHGQSHIHKKKKCPICRTIINERPVEVWGVKSMVNGIVRSGLIELPAPVPDETPTPAPEGPISSTGLNRSAQDPWRNIFHPVSHRSHFDYFAVAPPRLPRNTAEGGAGGGLEDMGMYDAEDGGIYRCIDCMHEIWDGVCTQCHREYPGHAGSEDGEGDEDDSEMEFGGGPNALARRRTLRDLLSMMAGERPNPFEMGGEDSESESENELLFEGGIDDDEDDEVEDEWGQVRPAHVPLFNPRVLPMFHPDLSGRRAPRLPIGGVAPRPPQPQELVFADFTDDEVEAEIPTQQPQLYAHFTDDEGEAGIARIEEAAQDGEGGGDDGYESSFIDDEDTAETSAAGASAARARPRQGATPRTRRGAPGAHDDEDVDEEAAEVLDDDEVEFQDIARHIGRSLRLARRGRGPGVGPRLNPIVIVDSEEEEETPNSPEIQVLRRRNRPIAISSDNEQPQRRRIVGRNRVVEDEESGDDAPEYVDVDSDDSDHEHRLDEDEEGDEGMYENDGSRAGPSSRLLRMMEREMHSASEDGEDDEGGRW
ncbi:hypothetical protein FPV67DRAFT_1501932 [Lyophyllum atratum]|nr:hypothetical protein FPV67DRAFT_1501932 [Lyophyllum atratum]